MTNRARRLAFSYLFVLLAVAPAFAVVRPDGATLADPVISRTGGATCRPAEPGEMIRSTPIRPRDPSQQGAGTGRIHLFFAFCTLTPCPVPAGNRIANTTFSPEGAQATIGAGAGGVGGNVKMEILRNPVTFLWQCVVTETTGTDGPKVISYYDHRDRLVERRVTNAAGADTIATTFSYPTERIMTVTTAGSAYGPCTYERLTDDQTTNVSEGGVQVLQLKHFFSGNEVVDQVLVNDDTGGGASVLKTVSETRTAPNSNQVTHKPWGESAMQSIVNGHFPTQGQGNQVTTTLTGPFGRGAQCNTLAGQLVSASQTAYGGSATTAATLNSLREISTLTSNRPGITQSFSTDFDSVGRASHLTGPDTNIALDYSFPGGGSKVTGTDSNRPQAPIVAEDSQGYLSQVQAYGEDDAGFVSTLSGSVTNTTLTPAGTNGADVGYTTGPWGHPLTRTLPGGSTYTTAWDSDGLLASATVPAPGGSANLDVSVSNGGLQRSVDWHDGYTAVFQQYRVGLPKSISDSVDSSDFKWDHFQLLSEAHTGGSAGLNGYKAERKYDLTFHRFEGTATKDGGNNALSSTTVVYDANSRPLNVIGPGFVAAYSYVAGTSVVSSLTRNSGLVTSLAPQDGRLRLGTISTNAQETFSASYTYNSQGLIATETSSQKPQEYFDYDTDGRLTRSSSTPSGDPPPMAPYDWIGTWDPVGNPFGFGLNPLNQITSRSNSQYCQVTGKVAPGSVVRLWANAALYPDPNQAQILTVTNGIFQWNWLHATGETWRTVPVIVEGRLAGAGDDGSDAVAIASYNIVLPPATTTFSHDNAGNRAADSKHNFTWDARGRLNQVYRNTAYAAVAGGGITVNCLYDAQGRRVGKTVLDTVTVSGTPTNRTTITKWLYDGWQPVMEETQVNVGTAQGPVQRKHYIWGLDLSRTFGGAGGIGGLLAVRDETASKTYFPVTDGRGNIVALVDSSAPFATVARWTYDAWGNTVSSDGNTALCPFGWQSKYRDAETGLIYFGLRYYDPATKRWLSRDPLGEAGGLNLYAYCHDDPVNNTDPLGLDRIQLTEGANGRIDVSYVVEEEKGPFGLITRDLYPPFLIGTTSAHWTCHGKSYSQEYEDVRLSPGDELCRYLWNCAPSVNLSELQAFAKTSHLAQHPGGREMIEYAFQKGVAAVIGGDYRSKSKIQDGLAPWVGGVYDLVRSTSPESCLMPSALNPPFESIRPTLFPKSNPNCATYLASAQSFHAAEIALAFLQPELLLEEGGEILVVEGVDASAMAAERTAAAIPESALVSRIRGKLDLYPQVIDPRTGRHIQFPSDIGGRVPFGQRASWGAKERGEFISEWYRRGYETPRGGWDKYDLHHIKPREFGGENNFWNLAPVERQTHQNLFNSFWREFTEL